MVASPVLYWLAIASLFGLGVMGVDKLLARGRVSRISERTLWLTALDGGLPGIFVAGLVFRHKISKRGFWVPVFAAAMIWIAVLGLLSF